MREGGSKDQIRVDLKEGICIYIIEIVRSVLFFVQRILDQIVIDF